MLVATIAYSAVSAITLAATVVHMRSQQNSKNVAIDELWKIRAYQEHPVNKIR